MKKEIREFHHSMQASIDDLPAEDRDVIASYKDLATVAELEDEIQSVNARLDMMSAGNPQAVKTFETREQQIRKTQDSLEKHIANLAEAQDKIKEIRGPWEKELDELIVKISDAFAHNFAQIGCAGEVAVYKDEEDFNSWSIQISVRFRYVCQVTTYISPS
jgi:chromosome segregation ATPase